MEVSVPEWIAVMCVESSDSRAREMEFLAAGRLRVRSLIVPVWGAGMDWTLMREGAEE